MPSYADGDQETGKSAVSAADARVLQALGSHRFLTAELAGDACGTSRRAAHNRLIRLHAAGLVAHDRRSAPVGTAKVHWWLTPAGRDVIGEPRLQRDEPGLLFVEHTLAVAAFAITLHKHGQAAGLRLDDWWREKAAWEGGFTLDGKPEQISPDGRAAVTAHPGTDAEYRLSLLVEVDRDTTSTGELVGKVARYLAYADARAWAGKHERCPVLLVLTTNEPRANTVLAKVAEHRRRNWWMSSGAGELLFGMCASVDDPQAAVTAPVWRREDDPALYTLTEQLDYRKATEQAALAEREELQAARRAAEIERHAKWLAREGRRLANPAHRSETVADVLSALLDRSAPAVHAWAEEHPDLAAELTGYLTLHDHVPLDAELADELHRQTPRLRQAQRASLLAARAAVEAGDPRWCRAARLLLAGRLAPGWLIEAVETPLSWQDCQTRLLRDYREQRDQAVSQTLAGRRPWQRTPADRLELEAAHDRANLLTCPSCDLQHHAAVLTNEVCEVCQAELGGIQTHSGLPADALYAELAEAAT